MFRKVVRICGAVLKFIKMRDIDIIEQKIKTSIIINFLSIYLKNEDIKKIYCYKTIIKKGNILNKLIKIIKNEDYYKLFFYDNNENEIFNLEGLDYDGIIYSVENFYEMFIIIDKEKNFYFCIIKNNVFFKDGAMNELVFFEKVKKFNFVFYLLNKKLIYNSSGNVSRLCGK